MKYEIYREVKNTKTDEQLKEEIRSNPASRIEYAKRRHGLYGDVYFIQPYNIIADADSHRASCPNSTATDIEDMAIERMAQIEAEQAMPKPEPVDSTVLMEQIATLESRLLKVEDTTTVKAELIAVKEPAPITKG